MGFTFPFLSVCRNSFRFNQEICGSCFHQIFIAAYPRKMSRADPKDAARERGLAAPFGVGSGELGGVFMHAMQPLPNSCPNLCNLIVWHLEKRRLLHAATNLVGNFLCFLVPPRIHL